MIFRIESQRDDQILAQGATLGTTHQDFKAPAGRQNLLVQAIVCRPAGAGDFCGRCTPRSRTGLISGVPLGLLRNLVF